MKKTFILGSVYLLIILPALTGCQQMTTPAPATTESPEVNMTYNNPEHTFSAGYPAGWVQKEDLTEWEITTGIVAKFLGPESAEYDYRATIMIEADKLPGEFTTAEYAEAVEEQILKKNLQNYVKLEEHTRPISDITALVKTFTATSKEAPHKYTQAYFIKGDICYIITYDATTDLYDKYVDFFDLTASTFKFE